MFPNLSVLENVAFGPRAARVPRAVARETARRWLREVDAEQLADRNPAQLSGGQAQRVAVARAVAADPRLLLLDEPLAALDVTAAPMLRRVLRDVLADRSVIIVTHDLLDAVLLSNRVIVLGDGRVVESRPDRRRAPPPDQPVHRPARRPEPDHRHRARTGRCSRPAADRSSAAWSAPRCRRASRPPPCSPPTPCRSTSTEPHGSPRNVFAVTITELEPRGDQVRVRATTASGESLTADVTAAAVGELDLYPGRRALYVVKATTVTLYPS